MKKYFQKHLISVIFLIAFALYILLSYINQWPQGLVSLHNFSKSSREMFSLLPVMFVLVGLFEVWVPRQVVVKHTGQNAGIMSILWLILLAMLQVGPLYGAFPVAYMLWKKGTSVRNVFIYLGAFTTLKIPMLSFEIGFLGLKFTILRTILSIPTIILVAILMDKLFASNFSMTSD